MANANWKITRMPPTKVRECSDELLVTWIPNGIPNEGDSIKLVSIAVYIPEHWCTLEDMGWSSSCFEDSELELERDKKTGSWWIPGGWYETIKNCIDHVGYMKIDGEVIAWDTLPKPCEKSDLRG